MTELPLNHVREDHTDKAGGQLVLLGFGVTAFTPAAYQRHSL